MVSPNNLLDLAFAAGDKTADAAEVIARAAEIIEGFAANAAVQALDALIATTELDSLGEAALAAQGIVQPVLHKARVLDDELGRFLITGPLHQVQRQFRTGGRRGPIGDAERFEHRIAARSVFVALLPGAPTLSASVLAQVGRRDQDPRAPEQLHGGRAGALVSQTDARSGTCRRKGFRDEGRVLVSPLDLAAGHGIAESSRGGEGLLLEVQHVEARTGERLIEERLQGSRVERVGLSIDV